MDTKPARLAVIWPISNEARNIAYFFDRIKKALERLDSIYLARTCQNRVRRRRFIVDRVQSSLPLAEGSAGSALRTIGAAVLEVECHRR